MSTSPRLSLRLASLALAALWVAPLASAQVIDQQQTNDTLCMANLSSLDIAQSFVPSGTNCVGGGFKMKSGFAAPETVTISLWSNLPNAGGTMYASGTATATPGQWVDVFWPAITVTPGVTYFLLIEGTLNGQCVAGINQDLYSRGHVYTNPGFDPFPSFDFTFRTFTDTSPVLSLTDVQPGAFMTFNIRSIAQSSTVVTLVSTAGGGPTNSPFGQISVSQPWMMTPPFPPNAAGVVNFTTTMPSSLSGLTLFMQAVELETGGAGELSNALAVPVP